MTTSRSSSRTRTHATRGRSTPSISPARRNSRGTFSGRHDMKSWRSRDLGQLFVSLGLLAIGGYTLVEARSIEAIRGYEQLGPRLFPNLIGACLLIIGTLLGWQAVAGGWRLMPE